jgi:hypothetical protein
MVIFCYQSVYCQEQEKVKDTAKVYRAIEKYSKGNKFKTFVYKLLFEPISKQKVTDVVVAKMKKQNYKQAIMYTAVGSLVGFGAAYLLDRRRDVEVTPSV